MADLGALDRTIGEWRARLAAASRNIVELTELPEYVALKSLVGRGDAQAAGRTAQQARTLIATMDELWQGLLLIGEAVDRADAARQKANRFWGADAAAAEIDRILTTNSLTLAMRETPVLNRDLLGSAQQQVAVSPAHLLDVMQGAFEHAKATISRLTHARAQLAPRQAQVAMGVAALEAQAWPAAPDLRARLDALQHMGATDPVGALDAMAAIETDVAAEQAALARLSVARAEAERAVAASRQAIDALAAATADARAANVQAQALVAEFYGPVIDDVAVAELSAWLDRLDAIRASGRLDAFRTGLANWRQMHDTKAAQVAAYRDRARAACVRREELRGRFSALEAKQSAIGAHDTTTTALAATLRGQLFGGAARLDEAAQTLRAFEAALVRTTPNAVGRA